MKSNGYTRLFPHQRAAPHRVTASRPDTVLRSIRRGKGGKRLFPHQRAAPHRVTAATYIAFDELPDENWAIAGKLLDEE